MNNKGFVTFFNLILLFVVSFTIIYSSLWEFSNSKFNMNRFIEMEAMFNCEYKLDSFFTQYEKNGLPNKIPYSSGSYYILYYEEEDEYVVFSYNTFMIYDLYWVKAIFFKIDNSKLIITDRRVLYCDESTFQGYKSGQIKIPK